MSSSYASIAALAQDEQFQERIKVSVLIECQAELDDLANPSLSNLAYDTLRGAEHVYNAFIRMVAQTPEVADAAGDPPDQSLVSDDLIKTTIDDTYPVVASMYYNVDGSPWSGAWIPGLGEGPSVDKVEPDSGEAGITVTVTGIGLSTTTAVNIGADLTDLLVVSDTEVTGTLTPVVAGSYPVQVTLEDGTVVIGPEFQVTLPPIPPLPTVFSFTPTSGPATVATGITVSGVSLTETTNVVVGDPCLNVAVVDDATVTATVVDSLAQGSYDVVLTVAGEDFQAADQYTVT